MGGGVDDGVGRGEGVGGARGVGAAHFEWEFAVGGLVSVKSRMECAGLVVCVFGL